MSEAIVCAIIAGIVSVLGIAGVRPSFRRSLKQNSRNSASMSRSTIRSSTEPMRWRLRLPSWTSRSGSLTTA